jgi:hypothetical protein
VTEVDHALMVQALLVGTSAQCFAVDRALHDLGGIPDAQHAGSFLSGREDWTQRDIEWEVDFPGWDQRGGARKLARKVAAALERLGTELAGWRVQVVVMACTGPVVPMMDPVETEVVGENGWVP